MKPANFPARKEERRRSALARVGTSPRTKLSPEQIAAERARIVAALNPVARAVRTKKLRGARRIAA